MTQALRMAVRAAAVTALVVAGAAVPAAAKPALVGAPALTHVPGLSYLTNLSCPHGSNDCLAIGIEYNSNGSFHYGFVLPVTNGKAGTAVDLPYPDQAAAVACTSATSCLVVGADATGGFFAPFTDGTLGTITTLASTAVLYAVSCGSASVCWATAANSAYQAADLVKINGSHHKVITLTGSYPFLFRGGEGGNTDLWCFTATRCTALGSENLEAGPGVVDQLDDGAVSSSQTQSGVATYSSVSCRSDLNCLGTGATPASAGVIDQISSGVPAAPTTISGSMWMAASACPSATQCAAVGFGGTEAYVTVTTSGTPATSSPFAGSLSGVACRSATKCWAVGRTGTSNTSGAVIYRFSL